MSAQLAIIGGGNMAQAIVFGALDAKVLAPGDVVICEPDAAKHEVFSSRGVRATTSHADALGSFAGNEGRVLLAVKPQSLFEVAEQVRPYLRNSCPIISILAGTSIARVSELTRNAPVIRAMPNTPARIRQGVTALAFGTGVLPFEREFAERLFAAVGAVVSIDESLMDAFTALAGSGPAYAFYLAEAMMSAAQAMGFDAHTADIAVRQTLRGAAELLAVECGSSPAQLRAAVTSKGGTTEAAIQVLNDRGVMRSIVEAIVAGRNRAGQLAEPNK